MPEPAEIRGNHGHEEPAVASSSGSGHAGGAASNDRQPSQPRYVAPFFPSGAQPEISEYFMLIVPVCCDSEKLLDLT